jgi:hypothetical protein
LPTSALPDWPEGFAVSEAAAGLFFSVWLAPRWLVPACSLFGGADFSVAWLGWVDDPAGVLPGSPLLGSVAAVGALPGCVVVGCAAVVGVFPGSVLLGCAAVVELCAGWVVLGCAVVRPGSALDGCAVVVVGV